jgi:hypothetical protein
MQQYYKASDKRNIYVGIKGSPCIRDVNYAPGQDINFSTRLNITYIKKNVCRLWYNPDYKATHNFPRNEEKALFHTKLSMSLFPMVVSK